MSEGEKLTAELTEFGDSACQQDSHEEDDGHERWYHINTSMIYVKLCYLLISMKESSYVPYLNLYLPSVGVPLSQSGIITGTRLVGFLCGSPLWGMVADKCKHHSFLFTMLCAISVLLMLPQPFIAVVLKPASSRIHCRSMNQSVANCSLVNATFGNESQDDGSTFTSQFWFHLIINIVMMFFDGALIGLNDSAAMTIIRNSPKKADFGRQRVFGAIGFGFGTPVTSLLIDPFQAAFPSMSKYSPMFFVYAFATCCYAICSSFMLKQRRPATTFHKEKVGLMHDLSVTVKQLPVMFFLSIAFVAGFDNGLHFGFCLKLLEELDAANILFGLSVAVAAVGAIFFYPFTSAVISMLRGTFPAFSVVLLAYVIRFLIYAYSTSPYVIVASQVLHCVCFALFVPAAVLHTSIVSPASVRSSMFGIMNGLHFGAGFMVANLVGGVLYQMYGRRTLFLSGFGLTTVWLFLVILYIMVDQRKLFKMEDRSEAQVIRKDEI